MKYVRGLIAKAEKFRPKLGSSRLSLMETTGRKLAGGRNAAVQWLVSRKEAAPSRPTRAEVAEELPVPEVLLVDDEPTKHVSVRELLVHSGYAVTAATSTEEALRILSERFAEDGYNSFLQ